jgi:acetyltransferase-like isoleucine patch superfamily enzyme
VSKVKQQSFLFRIRGKGLHEWVSLVASIPSLLRSRFYYPAIFAEFGARSILAKPTLLVLPRHIHIGKGVVIRPGVRLEIVRDSTGRSPLLRIGNNTGIEQNVHIVCHHRVTIGDNVSITANCAIVDTTHPFDDIPSGIRVGSLITNDDAFVEIGDGTFLGFGSIVLPNVRIGKGCMIGAHSVVTRDIPDYSVAAGAPARILRPIRKLKD